MTRHFCFCLSLKTGAFVMSFLNLLLGCTEILISIIELSHLEQPVDFEKIRKHVDLVEKFCNNTKICNETTIVEIVPTGEPGIEGNTTLFTVCLLVGIISVFNGVLLLIGLMQAKEKHILWYVLFGSVTVLIMMIYSGIMMFHNGLLLIFFVLSIFMCYGQLAMYYLYEEILEYNTVKSGVIEISYNGDAKGYINSTADGNDEVDNTAV